MINKLIIKKEFDMVDKQKFPENLFVYNAWPVISEILKRRFDDMWNDAKPVDIDNVADDNIDIKKQ